ncbi:AbrB/MazE/SpoVT family DNA-binding domain-containing protein [Candidatus Saganbacteria bacterium]|nr:AbrB/MazE/SpoVT family DNA-binding domain-containing protein [Candidatus Saganbacteria bacterium]
MAESVLTSKGQITLPKDIREGFDLGKGDVIDFVREKDWIIMVPRKGNLLDLFGSVKHKGKPLDFTRLRAKVLKAFIKSRHD